MTLVCDERFDTAAATDTTTERRRGLRIRQQRPVKVLEVATNRYVGGCTMDVSASGLRLELPLWAPVMAGKTVEVHVGVDAASGSPLANRRKMIPARVVWVDRSRENRRVTVGIEFLASIAAHLDAA